MRYRAWIVLLALACTACGRGDAQSSLEREDLKARVLSLEKRVDELAQAARAADESPPVTPPVPEVDWAKRPYSQDQIDWFGGLKEATDEIERRERYAAMIGRQLDRTEVPLTDEQRELLVKTSISIWNRMRDAMRKAQERGDDLETRQALIDGIRNEYEQAINSMLPALDAEKVLQSVGRYSGFGERR